MILATNVQRLSCGPDVADLLPFAAARASTRQLNKKVELSKNNLGRLLRGGFWRWPSYLSRACLYVNRVPTIVNSRGNSRFLASALRRVFAARWYVPADEQRQRGLLSARAASWPNVL